MYLHSMHHTTCRDWRNALVGANPPSYRDIDLVHEQQQHSTEAKYIYREYGRSIVYVGIATYMEVLVLQVNKKFRKFEV